MSITTTDFPYELAVGGNNIGAISFSGTGENSGTYVGTPINDFPSGTHTPDGLSGTFKASGSNAAAVYYVTDGAHDTIKWRLESEYDRYDEGMGPDSHGSFTFYVLPKKNGDLKIKVKLSVEGYSADVSKNDDQSFHAKNLKKIKEGSAEYAAMTYLNSHLLFFSGRTGAGTAESPYYYTGLIDDELELSFRGCKEKELIPVTIYWVWPNTFAQLACISERGNVANESGTTADSKAVAELRKYLIDNSSEILKDITEEQALEYMGNSGADPSGAEYWDFNKSLAVANLTALSMGYNKADQQIGTTVNYFLLILTAE